MLDFMGVPARAGIVVCGVLPMTLVMTDVLGVRLSLGVIGVGRTGAQGLFLCSDGNQKTEK